MPPRSRPDASQEPARRTGVIPRTLVDENAAKVVRRLQEHGHEAYLVGGCVRDLLAGLEPKDFDVATDAHPGRIRKLFRNARIIGRRFRLAHIRFGRDSIIETATFRADPGEEDSENVYGTAPEDARRRDFTVNALFYDPAEDAVLDWTGGLEDLDAGVIRAIGDPDERMAEDPVRMIRAVHFSERLGFRLEQDLERSIDRCSHLLADASQARLYVELIKVLRRGSARDTLHRLHALGVLGAWLPELVPAFDANVPWPEQAGGTHEEARHGEPEDVPVGHATWNLLAAADRVLPGLEGPSEGLVLAPLLAPWLMATWREAGGGTDWHAYVELVEETLRPLAVRMSMPRRASGRAAELAWMLMTLRHPPEGKRAVRVVRRSAFPEALVLLRLDLDARDADASVADAWEALGREHPPRPSGRGKGRGRGRGQGGSRGRGDGRRGGRQRRGGRGRGGGRRRKERDDGGIGTEAAAWTPPPPPKD